jgi:hypothetical protein
MERESKCGADFNVYGIKFKKAMGPPQITKILTMCDFLDRCVGRRVDRGACGANVQVKSDLLV